MPLSIFERHSAPLNIQTLAVTEPEVGRLSIRNFVSVDDWKQVNEMIKEVTPLEALIARTAANVVSQVTQYSCDFEQAFSAASANTYLEQTVQDDDNSLLTKLLVISAARQLYGITLGELHAVHTMNVFTMAVGELKKAKSAIDFPLSLAHHLCRAFPLFAGDKRHISDEFVSEYLDIFAREHMDSKFNDLVSMKVLRPSALKVTKDMIEYGAELIEFSRENELWFQFVVHAANLSILTADDVQFGSSTVSARMQLVTKLQQDHTTDTTPPLQRNF